MEGHYKVTMCTYVCTSSSSTCVRTCTYTSSKGEDCAREGRFLLPLGRKKTVPIVRMCSIVSGNKRCTQLSTLCAHRYRELMASHASAELQSRHK